MIGDQDFTAILCAVDFSSRTGRFFRELILRGVPQRFVLRRPLIVRREVGQDSTVDAKFLLSFFIYVTQLPE